MFPDPTAQLEAACAGYLKRVLLGAALLAAAGLGLPGAFLAVRGGTPAMAQLWLDVTVGSLGTLLALGSIPPLVRAHAQLRRWRAFVQGPEFAQSFARQSARRAQGTKQGRTREQQDPAPRKPLLDLRRRALEALGLDETADAHAIRRRHRELVLAFHPDRQLHLPPEQQAAAAERFHEVQRAYEFLRS